MIRAYKGFTLIEILIALSLLSLILVMVFSSLHTSSKTWQAGDQQIEKNDSQRLMLDFIRNQLTQTVPLSLIDGKDNYVLFHGESAELRFVARLPAHRGGGGLYWQSLRIDAGQQNMGLVLSYEALQADSRFFDSNMSDKTKTVSLIQDIDEIKFSYFGKKKQQDEATWHKQWKEQKLLPTLLRIQFSSSEATSWWPELVIAIRPQHERGQAQLNLHKPKSSSQRS